MAPIEAGNLPLVADNADSILAVALRVPDVHRAVGASRREVSAARTEGEAHVEGPAGRLRVRVDPQRLRLREVDRIERVHAANVVVSLCRGSRTERPSAYRESVLSA